MEIGEPGLAKSFNIFFAAVLGHHESPKLRGGRKQKGLYYYEYCFMVQVVCVGSIFCFLEKNFNLHP